MPLPYATQPVPHAFPTRPPCPPPNAQDEVRAAAELKQWQAKMTASAFGEVLLGKLVAGGLAAEASHKRVGADELGCVLAQRIEDAAFDPDMVQPQPPARAPAHARFSSS